VVEPPKDAAQVADAVAVAVRERARIDLVDGAALPPRKFVSAADAGKVRERGMVVITGTAPA
jgi:hypothetical protein